MPSPLPLSTPARQAPPRPHSPAVLVRSINIHLKFEVSFAPPSLVPHSPPANRRDPVPLSPVPCALTSVSTDLVNLQSRWESCTSPAAPARARRATRLSPQSWPRPRPPARAAAAAAPSLAPAPAGAAPATPFVVARGTAAPLPR